VIEYEGDETVDETYGYSSSGPKIKLPVLCPKKIN